MGRECATSDEDDHDLCGNDDELYADEEPIAEDTFEDIEIVIQTPVVVLVEDLHPDKDVENECRKLILFS